MLVVVVTSQIKFLRGNMRALMYTLMYTYVSYTYKSSEIRLLYAYVV